VFIAIRESVKRQRQEIIKDLQTVFHLPGAPNRDDIVPSFEFVKYKYFFKRADDDNHERGDFSLYHWIVSSIPLVIFMFAINALIANIFTRRFLGLDYGYDIASFPTGSPLPIYFWVVITAYAGGFIFMIRSFYRAINNFDLSPLSFVGAFLNLATGMIVAVIFVYGVMHVVTAAAPETATGAMGGSTQSAATSALFGAAIVTAFVIGIMPELATRNLIWSSRLRYYKKDDIEVYKSFSAIPVEVIDGIDTEIRDKLADFHINAVQNLAAANPLMLFVETPYGVYQIMDWVAQAQLCCSVGPRALIRLWNLGIRTIFDLERAALDGACNDKDLLLSVGRIILNQSDSSTETLSNEMVTADIRLRLEHPHVQRLRQLFTCVRDRLGKESQRLPPIIECPQADDRLCPFGKKDLARAA
jgi:hypothetical protein